LGSHFSQAKQKGWRFMRRSPSKFIDLDSAFGLIAVGNRFLRHQTCAHFCASRKTDYTRNLGLIRGTKQSFLPAPFSAKYGFKT
jgi:hypothetical protein